MAVCSRCGTQLNPQERFCGNCGMDSQAPPPQGGWVPVPSQAAPGHRCGCTARAAMGLGIGGGLLGILWGALGPYLSLKFPTRIGWFYGGINPYMTGIRPVILLIVGLVLGLFAILAGSVAPKALGLARVVLPICGLVGFLLGPSWVPAGTLLLAAAGLAFAAKPQ